MKIPSSKISETILEFGKDLILSLPENHTKEEFEAVITIVITAWNAVVMDTWDAKNHFENDLLSQLDKMPKEIKIMIKRLIKRKKKNFADDIRGVGRHWLREENGEYIFGCEARLNVENVPADSSIH